MKRWIATVFCLVWISDFTAVVEPGPCQPEEEDTEVATIVGERSGVSFECKWFRDLCTSGAELEQANKEDETQ